MSSKGGKNLRTKWVLRFFASERGAKEHKGNDKRPAGIFNLLKIFINVPIIRKILKKETTALQRHKSSLDKTFWENPQWLAG